MIPQKFHADYPIDELVEHPENPRRGNVEMIRASIAHNDFYGAVLVQKSTGRLVAGNHRVRAARAEGRTTVPALVADLTDEQARRILLVDNRANDMAGYDDEDLSQLLASLAETPDALAGTGYDDIDLAGILERLNPPSLEDLGRMYAPDDVDDGMVTFTIKLLPEVASSLRDAIADQDGVTDSERVASLIVRAGAYA